MNILVVGCGRLGSSLAEKLDRLGHDVSVVDAGADSFHILSEDFSGICVAGMPMDMQVLKKAGVESCDAVVVATPDDNLNITVAQIVRRFFAVENVVVRISDPRREDVFRRFGLRSVCPTNLAGDVMAAALTSPWGARQVSFGTASVSFRSLPVGRALDGTNASMLPLEAGEVVFGVVHQDGKMELCGGNPQIVLREGDQAVFANVSD